MSSKFRSIKSLIFGDIHPLMERLPIGQVDFSHLKLRSEIPELINLSCEEAHQIVLISNYDEIIRRPAQGQDAIGKLEAFLKLLSSQIESAILIKAYLSSSSGSQYTKLAFRANRQGLSNPIDFSSHKIFEDCRKPNPYLINKAHCNENGTQRFESSECLMVCNFDRDFSTAKKAGIRAISITEWIQGYSIHQVVS